VTEIFDRPLTDAERQFLVKELAAGVLAEQAPAPCTIQEARDVLARLAAEGKLTIEGNAEDVYVRANGTLLVEAKRDWLSFHSQYRGNDPMKDKRLGGVS
jgi:hypothetical protein